MVRCKFKVDRIERSLGSKNDGHNNWVPVEQWTVVMSPVYGNGDPNHENTRFWQATPCGQIQFTCVNKDAVDQMDLGKEYYIDISPAS